MNYRRVIQCCAITCLVAIALPHAAAADDGKRKTGATEDCQTSDSSSDDSHDADHDAGERDRDHEHDGHSKYERSKPHHHGAVHVRRRYEHHHGHDDDCLLVPPAEVAEAPFALLLPASGVLTGAAVLLVRRRNKGPRINAA
jgi:hypothetical protein